MTDEQIEQTLQAKGLNAPRLTPTDIEAAIVHEHYFTAAHGVIGNLDDMVENGVLNILDETCICVMILKNGFKIIGVNTGGVSSANFDMETARTLARQDAIDQIWPLLGYELKTQLAKDKP